MSKSRSCDESAVLIAAGRFGDARRLIGAALEKAPRDAQLLSAKATLLFEWDRLLEARDAVERASQAGMKGVDFLLKLGRIRHATGDFDGAERCFREAIASSPGDIEAL